MFERRRQPLLSLREFHWRLIKYALFAVLFVAIALFAGILGYHCFEGLSWLDSLLNASMILGGMGPVDTLHTSASKIFASCYALFSGIVFIASAGILIALIFHRFLHYFHADVEVDEDK